jgi:hypothetical protein
VCISASKTVENSWTAKSDCETFVEVPTGISRFDMISVRVLDRKDCVHHNGRAIVMVLAVSGTNRRSNYT